MKILACVGGAYIYGAEEVSLKAIAHLADTHAVHCAINGWNDGAFPARLDETGIPYTAIKLGWIYLSKPLWTIDTLVHAPKAYYSYFTLLRRFGPDVCYHSSYRTIVSLYPLLNPKNVLHVHDRIVDDRSRRFLGLINKKVAFYIAISRLVKDDLIACGIAESKIRLVYNGVDFSNAQAVDFPSRKTGVVQIGIVGQLVPRKGHAVLLKALGSIKRQGLDFVLHVFGLGDASLSSSLRQLAEDEGIASLIKWHGYVQDKKAIYSMVDFCVVPSIAPEPFGLTAVEPAVYGRCVVASHAGGLKEIVEDDNTGLFFEPGNADMLAERLAKLLINPDNFVSMGMNAMRIYAVRFPEHAMLAGIENVLKEVAT